MTPEVVIDTPAALARAFADRVQTFLSAEFGRAERRLRRLGKVAALEAGTK